MSDFSNPKNAADSRVSHETIDRAIARVPKWMTGLAVAGTAAEGWFGGLSYAGAFLAGAMAAQLNFWLIERFVNRLGDAASPKRPASAARTGVQMFIRFLFIALGALVILRFTGINVIAALCGFLVCPAAVILEIFYELLTYGHS